MNDDKTDPYELLMNLIKNIGQKVQLSTVRCRIHQALFFMWFNEKCGNILACCTPTYIVVLTNSGTCRDDFRMMSLR